MFSQIGCQTAHAVMIPSPPGPQERGNSALHRKSGSRPAGLASVTATALHESPTPLEGGS